MFGYDFYLQKFHFLIWSVMRDQRISLPRDLPVSFMLHFLLKVHVSITLSSYSSYCLDSSIIIICLMAYFVWSVSWLTIITSFVSVENEQFVCAYTKTCCADLQITAQQNLKFWTCIFFNITDLLLHVFSQRICTLIASLCSDRSRIW